jgi:hypothetical protein
VRTIQPPLAIETANGEESNASSAFSQSAKDPSLVRGQNIEQGHYGSREKSIRASIPTLKSAAAILQSLVVRDTEE